MRTGLFRKEVLLRNLVLLMDVFNDPKTCLFCNSWPACGLDFAVIIYLNTGSYARKASVSGWLEPSHGVFKLYAMQGAAKCLMYWSVKVN